MTDALDLRALSEELSIPLAELEAAQAAGTFDLSDEDAADAIARWLDDPVAFVREVFGGEPDAWQADTLRAGVKDARLAMKACKGPGKSTGLAWLCWWGLALHIDANGLALSITRDNLRDGLWKELALWYAKSPWLQRSFEMSSERIFAREAKDTWWLSARGFAKDADATQQANTLAGLHAPSFVFIAADEVSDYPDGVMGAAEGIFANVGVEAHLWCAGNPTRTEGPLYNACTRDRALWTVIEVTGDPDDPKRSPRINVEYARKVIQQWGPDNPWVLVNILGKFPPAGEDKLLGPNDVTAAEARDVPRREFEDEALVWSLDVARFGTDASVLTKRQGPVAFRQRPFRNLDGPTLANQVSFAIHEDMRRPGGRRPDALYVDVGGVGASAYDHLKLLGWGDILVAVDFGSSADEPDRFANKKAEMWWRMAEWVKKRGCLPTQSGQLGSDLVAPRFFFRVVNKRTVFILESKDDLKKRGVASPDYGDSLATTFYSEVVVRRDHRALSGAHHAHRVVTEYSVHGGGERAVTDYDPYGRTL